MPYLLKLFLAIALALTGTVACDSNPTPHPQQPDGKGGRTDRPEPADQPNTGAVDDGQVDNEFDGDPAASVDASTGDSMADGWDGDAAGAPGDVEGDGEVSAPAPSDQSGACQRTPTTPSDDGDDDTVERP